MKFLQLNWKDVSKGLILATLTAIMEGLSPIVSGDAPHLPSGSELQIIGGTALTAMIAYLVKNFFTNSKDQFLKKE